MSTDRENANYWYNELVEGLRLIASEFDVQERALPDFVHLPDEVLNAVDLDTLSLVVELGLVTQEQTEKIKQLDCALENIELPSNYEAMIEDMKNGNSFNTLRKMAHEVLNSLGQTYKEPATSAVYVKSS
ncbi:hypothetical protein [Pseudoalteromonas sp.]|uniref:hypothetical protein n=1 Tax=Pseudoalteromonas sp. TaxID=53249 RepID=UPI001BCCC581|nr:hypothetical protein [Pseudoalteromonas sp.]